MRRSRFSEEQIIGILKEHEAGVPVSDLCRKHGVSDASIYKWKARFGGMDVSEAKRLRALEDVCPVAFGTPPGLLLFLLPALVLARRLFGPQSLLTDPLLFGLSPYRLFGQGSYSAFLRRRQTCVIPVEASGIGLRGEQKAPG